MEKKHFYDTCKILIECEGFKYFNEKEIKGIGKKGRKKPDFVAVNEKDKIFIIGEIKTPKENPKSSSWRQIQKSDTAYFAELRLLVRELEKERKINKEVGGHIIILLGQIIDYFKCFGKTYNFPIDINEFKVCLAYCAPAIESSNIEEAMNMTCIKLIRKLQSFEEEKCSHLPIIFTYEIPYNVSYSCSNDFLEIEIDISKYLNRIHSLILC